MAQTTISLSPRSIDRRIRDILQGESQPLPVRSICLLLFPLKSWNEITAGERNYVLWRCFVRQSVTVRRVGHA